MTSPFVERLRQRKLVQWGLGYLAGAWVALQVFGQVGQSFGWPPGAMRVITVALGMGLLPTLVLAFYHGERGQQRVSAPELLVLLAAFTLCGSVVWTVGRTDAGGGAGTAPAAADRHAVAVLPFASHSGEQENAYFASGIHDELLTQLAKVGDLKVISRTSVLAYRDSRKTLKEIAGELGVGVVLEGSVQRAGNRVRVQAQLIDAATDKHLWAETYDRELRDVLGIQAEIAQQIATALHASLSHSAETQLARVRQRSVNPAMYDVYLRGLGHAGEGRHHEAIETFRRALAVDAGYAPAYAGIARSYYVLGFFGDLAPAEAFGAMRDAAARAVRLDPDLADAHATLALHALHREWDWKAADAHFRQALALSPNHAQVRHDYAHYLLAVGRIEESVAESQRAAELDPANTMLKACTGWHDFSDREYDHAVSQAMGALMMMPGSFWPEIILGWAYEHKGQHNDAILHLRNAVTHSRGSPFAVAALAHAQAEAGERTPARQLLRTLEESARERYVSAYDMAVVQAGLGETDEAFAWLERAFAERSAMLVNIGWDPRFDAIREEPRFRALTDRMRLPARPRPDERRGGRPAVRSM